MDTNGGGWKLVKYPPEGCHPEGLEGSGLDRWRGAGVEAEMSRPAFARGYGGQAPLDMTGIQMIRVHPWLDRGS